MNIREKCVFHQAFSKSGAKKKIIKKYKKKVKKTHAVIGHQNFAAAIKKL